MQASDVGEVRSSYFQMMEAVPTDAWLGAAFGSMGLSLLMRLLGKKDAAVFFGLWPPTFLLMALAHKLIRPSHEDPFQEGQDAVRQASQFVSANR